MVSIFVLLEKGGLGNRLFGFPKVAQANTDETIALLRTELYPLSQPQRNVGQFLPRGWSEPLN
jgi:hypothetical protein